MSQNGKLLSHSPRDASARAVDLPGRRTLVGSRGSGVEFVWTFRAGVVPMTFVFDATVPPLLSRCSKYSRRALNHPLDRLIKPVVEIGWSRCTL